MLYTSQACMLNYGAHIFLGVNVSWRIGALFGVSFNFIFNLILDNKFSKSISKTLTFLCKSGYFFDWYGNDWSSTMCLFWLTRKKEEKKQRLSNLNNRKTPYLGPGTTYIFKIVFWTAVPVTNCKRESSIGINWQKNRFLNFFLNF